MKFVLIALGASLAISVNAQVEGYVDTAFIQEYHKPFRVTADKEITEVRSISVDAYNNVWIATDAGIRMKKEGSAEWSKPFSEIENGPAFCVLSNKNGDVFMGTWKGVYLYQNNTLKWLAGTEGPISAICSASEGIYAAGPKGIWLYKNQSFTKQQYSVARSIRKIISDNSLGLWVASDVGLYHCTPAGVQHFVDTSKLISAYIKGLAFDRNHTLWAGGLGGVSILKNGKKETVITPANGCPSIYVNCLAAAANGSMWVGTDVGVVRFERNGSHSLLFSNRWLLDDRVTDIAFDTDGNAWIATPGGVSAIMKNKMTLASKQDYFYDVLMKRHIRAPWIAGISHLDIPGDVSSWQPEDDDNDGEFTGNYLAMEAFRYAATKDPDAREKAAKAFQFLKTLEEITGGDGYFARSIVPVSWKDRIHDGNRTYTEREIADELVKEPRFKPVEVRWRPSADGQWLWKGDASSDEWCGHMLGYYFYYTLAADDAEKERVRRHVAKLVDHVIANDFYMMDVDGSHTRWSVWSPNSINKDPEWQPDRATNSMEILAFLKLAYFMTGDRKYEDNYLRLINKEHYLDNMARMIEQNPAWFIYYDVTMQAYLYPILLHCEKDPKKLAFYRQHLENWMKRRVNDKNPLINFLYTYSSGKPSGLPASIDFLKDTPLDLVDWHIDHTKREDVQLVHQPVLDDLQVSELPPASIRMVVRWDKNPWAAKGGSPVMEREPVFWLLPYWMGRYMNLIK